VQGVAFRKSTEVEARRIGLAGWVRNLTDGRVELEAEGAPEAVEALLRWARRGPALARVDDLAVEERRALGEPGPFVVRR
jgi:acylphosphatase